MLDRRPSPLEVYNDLDDEIVTLFRVLRDAETGGALARWLVATPYSRAEYDQAVRLRQGHRRGQALDDITLAWAVVVTQRQSMGGTAKPGSWGVEIAPKGNRSAADTFADLMSDLPRIVERMRRVHVERAPAIDIVRRYDHTGAVFYLDPPYAPETRRSGGYRCEMTTEDHERLVEVLLTVEGSVTLSGYPTATYQPLEAAGWRRIEIVTTCSAAARTRASGLRGTGAALASQKRTEAVWLNPRCQSLLAA